MKSIPISNHYLVTIIITQSFLHLVSVNYNNITHFKSHWTYHRILMYRPCNSLYFYVKYLFSILQISTIALLYTHMYWYCMYWLFPVMLLITCTVNICTRWYWIRPRVNVPLFSSWNKSLHYITLQLKVTHLSVLNSYARAWSWWHLSLDQPWPASALELVLCGRDVSSFFF